MRAPLGCFHILATVYSVAMSVHVHVFCLNTCFQFFWHGAAGSHGNSVFNFGGAGKLVSKEDVPFHIPSALCALLCIHLSLPTLATFCLQFFVLRCGSPIGVSSAFPLGKITVSFPSWRMDWVGVPQDGDS